MNDLDPSLLLGFYVASSEAWLRLKQVLVEMTPQLFSIVPSHHGALSVEDDVASLSSSGEGDD